MTAPRASPARIVTGTGDRIEPTMRRATESSPVSAAGSDHAAAAARSHNQAGLASSALPWRRARRRCGPPYMTRIRSHRDRTSGELQETSRTHGRRRAAEDGPADELGGPEHRAGASAVGDHHRGFMGQFAAATIFWRLPPKATDFGRLVGNFHGEADKLPAWARKAATIWKKPAAKGGRRWNPMPVFGWWRRPPARFR